MEFITNNLVVILGMVGALAFMLNIIVEITKDIGFLKRIPTTAYVLLLSPILCVLAYFSYVSYMELKVYWYMLFFVIMGSFVVAYVATYGWDKLFELWKRFNKEV
jgi:hypothetical protein